ncbi:MAG TPA: NAD(P)H-binding protein [Terriglobales bacterium]|nr:NAD(P)H-binding protein [Terriglobales bacterium]
MESKRREVFLTGGTGYIGTALARELLQRGHLVRVLARPGSEHKVPAGCQVLHGDALRADTYAAQVAPADTLVHLVGVPHPNPKKAAQFRSIDLESCRQAIKAASLARVQHFIYLSVARPAPVMQEYQIVRAQGEALITESGIAATFMRPWYVLGPGHRWPALLVPLYALARIFPSTRAGAERLALVTLEQMTRTLIWSVENPAPGIRALEPFHIRRGFGDSMLAQPRVASA